MNFAKLYVLVQRQHQSLQMPKVCAGEPVWCRRQGWRVTSGRDALEAYLPVYGTFLYSCVVSCGVFLSWSRLAGRCPGRAFLIMSGTLRAQLASRPTSRRATCIGIKATLAPARKPSPPPRQQTPADGLPANNVVLIPGSVSASQLSQLPQQPAKPTGRVVLERPEELRSTLQHRLWVGGTSALLAGVLCSGLAQVHDFSSAAAAGAAALAAYVSADFASAVYHWAVDNYGDGSTPLVGGQIAAFQGHHQRPWTITEREFCNNVHLVFKPAFFFAAPLLLAAPHAPLAWNVWASTATLLVCLSQQFHAWSHMKKSELPAAVVALQDAGLLIGRKEHGAHHKAPFIAKYSIVSGWVNPWLDGSCPEKSAWRQLELFVHARTGVEPRCWHEPDYSWQEQERPAA